MFWSRVDKSPGQGPGGDCWEWTAGRNDGGYGTTGWQGRLVLAHRLAFELATGTSTALKVLHSCDNRPCCNPKHLREGTQAQNVQDRVDRGRGFRPVGTANPRAILDDDAVRAILVRLKAGEGQSAMARELGVSSGTIAHIHQGISWRHIKRE